MKKLALLLALFVIAVTVEAANPRKIMSVSHVTAVKRGNAIWITATGDVNSGGWTRPRLMHRSFSRDGVLTYQFMATPPDGMATQAIVEVQADTVYRGNRRVTRVRVNAANDSVTADVK